METFRTTQKVRQNKKSLNFFRHGKESLNIFEVKELNGVQAM